MCWKPVTLSCVDRFPVTTSAGFVAGVIQAIIVALGDAVSFFSALLWTCVLFIFVAEGVWNLGLLRHWNVERRILICAAIFLLFCGASYIPLESLYFSSDENLAVSFQYNNQENKNNIDVEYLFLNKGKDSVLVSGVGLFEIVASQSADDPRNNIALCNDSANSRILTSLLFMRRIMGNSAQMGGNTRRSAIYDPIQLTVDGAAWPANLPISIESGKNRIITARFFLESAHLKGFEVAAWCPLVATLDTRSRGGVSICKGVAFTRTGLGNSSITDTSHEQYRILPFDPAHTCPLAD
jgi:hypothetical protein